MKSLKAICLAASLALAATAANAQTYNDAFEETPSAGAMAFDLLIVRPLALVGTVAGVGLFVVTLPLSVVQGEPPSEEAQRFIVEPAKYTFTRELGKMK